MVCSKMVAATRLAYPSTKLSAEEEAVKDEIDKHAKQCPPGANEKAFELFRSNVGAQASCGYDPLKHFRKLTSLPPEVLAVAETQEERKGSFVDPAYQRRGLGSWLTQHCNAIADGYGKDTFVGVRPAGKRMFESQGFKVVGTFTTELSEYGGTGTDTHLSMRREYDGRVEDGEHHESKTTG